MFKSHSLSIRLLWSAALVLLAFFAIVVLVLQKAFENSTEQALKEKMYTQLYALLSVAEVDSNVQLQMPAQMREPRLSNPGSGLYAMIRLSDDSVEWRSTSAVGLELPKIDGLEQGQSLFFKDPMNDFYILHYAVLWENEAGFERGYVFTVADDGRSLISQVAEFRHTLISWLMVIGSILVLVQLMVFRWSLKPLREIVNDLEQIEQAKKLRLDGHYPVELKGLAGNLNALISSERAHMERYRNTLADLSHSLKTPLAILTGCVASEHIERDTIDHQIVRMNEIIEYQLQKAAAKGQQQLPGRINLKSVLSKILASLNKVYFAKNIHFELMADEETIIYCEEGDLYEIVGNLLDNACKWCQSNVIATVETYTQVAGNEYSVRVTIEDDGPGITPEMIDVILQRGVRADQNITGHGIGMAIVNELLELLGGKLEAGKSQQLGGMLWRVYLP